ncbi:MAG: hypothetical protein ABSH09_02720 [Bryobacteraceae bacterium]|jgi:hypothetical protein
MAPVRFKNLAIIGFLAVTCFDIVTGLEHWPFGSYPMYSLLYSEQLDWLRLYGVTERGEIALRGERDFAPFDEARLVMALDRLRTAPKADRKLDEALRNLMELYNRRNPGGPSISSLRLYTVRWTLRLGVQGSEPPQERVLVAQVTAQ